MMKISLLMPIYNLGKRGVEVFKAVNNLELPEDCEVIVLDDGSYDGYSTLFEELNAGENKYFFKKPHNQGRSEARNELARLAKGKWLLFVDGDCTFDPLFLYRWVKILEGRVPDHCVVGRVKYEETTFSGLSNYLNLASGPWDKGLKFPISHRYFATGHICIPQKKFHQVQGFDSRFCDWGGEDFDLGNRLDKIGVQLDLQTRIAVSHPVVRDVKTYMWRLRIFAKTGLRILLKETDEDFFGLKKYGNSILKPMVKIPLLEWVLLSVLRLDLIRWPFFMYRALIFITCMKYFDAKKKYKSARI